jgi:RimJ/RimL family protein N-acetyltransferase
MYSLITERLSLREVTASDLENIHGLFLLPETDYYNALGIPESIDFTRDYINNWIVHQQKNPRTLYPFVIEAKDSNQFIGLIGLIMGKPKYRNAEAWFKIHKDQWGQGYATEAFKCLIAFGFHDLGLHRIEAGCAIENIASSKVIQKAGLTLEGINRKLLPHQGGWLDCYSFAILEED